MEKNKRLFFTYGTFRQGEANEAWLKDMGVYMLHGGYTTGQMYSMADAYPVVHFHKDYTGEGNKVFGDICEVDVDNPLWWRASQMEVGVGYVPIYVPVKWGNGDTWWCLSFHFSQTEIENHMAVEHDGKPILTRIHSGDWRLYKETKQWAKNGK